MIQYSFYSKMLITNEDNLFPIIYSYLIRTKVLSIVFVYQILPLKFTKRD